MLEVRWYHGNISSLILIGEVFFILGGVAMFITIIKFLFCGVLLAGLLVSVFGKYFAGSIKEGEEHAYDVRVYKIRITGLVFMAVGMLGIVILAILA